MDHRKLEQLQKMYEDGLITENELKAKREKIISEIIDSDIDPGDCRSGTSDLAAGSPAG